MMFMQWLNPPPVTWDDISRVSSNIESIDRDIDFIRLEQQKTRDIYMFASMEYQVQFLMQRRIELSVQRQDLLVLARRQGPLVNSDLYCKFQ